MIYALYFTIFIVALVLAIKFLSPKYSQKSNIIKELKKLDFNDGKTSAYQFTALARQLELNEREQRLFDDIYDMLKDYKYRPQTQKLDSKVIAKIEIFIGSVE